MFYRRFKVGQKCRVKGVPYDLLIIERKFGKALVLYESPVMRSTEWWPLRMLEEV